MRKEAAVIAAKLTGSLSRTLRAGGGTALPGLVAERIDPRLVEEMARTLGAGSVLITGTNGKTTTARIVRRIVSEAGFRPVANGEGSNMMRGIASSLAGASDWRGSIPSSKRSLGIFEVDEATLPRVQEAVRPRAVLFSNLFRDQLDRYGEVESVASLWQAVVESWPPDVSVILNADDPSVASLRGSAPGKVLTFGFDDSSFESRAIEHAADARWCRACGHELEYTAVFYGHIGHWSCPACENGRPPRDVSCTGFSQDTSSISMTIVTPSSDLSVTLPLTGMYNAYNVLAAVAACLAMDLDPSAIEQGLAGVTAAFGRQERISIDGRSVEIVLAKNPAGLNQVLRTITRDPEPLDVLFLLNDRIADGKDISWIWDVDFEILYGHVRTLCASGDRAWDMALRLKYAGLSDSPRVEGDTASALRTALEGTAGGGKLYVIPTYTAMLDARNILGKWAGKGAFWEGGS